MAIRVHTAAGRVFVRIEGLAARGEVEALNRELWVRGLAHRAKGLVLVISDRTRVPDWQTRTLLLQVLERARDAFGGIDCVIEGARPSDGLRRLAARLVMKAVGCRGGLQHTVGAFIATAPDVSTEDKPSLWRQLRAAGLLGG